MSFKDRLGKVAKQAQESTRTYKDKVADATSAGVARTSEVAATRRDSARESIASAKDRFDDMEIGDLLNRVQCPTYPVSEPWHWSLGQMITAGEKPKRGTGTLLKQLDRFGRIDISPELVGFDGKTAKWDKVKVLRTRSLEDLISQLLTEGGVESIRGMLPPVPGRKWAAKQAVGALFTLWALTAEQAMSSDEAAQRQVVCEIEYKGWIRTKEAETGWFTGPVMAQLPTLDDVFRAEANRRGIPVESAETDSTAMRANERAAWLREKQESILKRRNTAMEEIEEAPEDSSES